MSSTFHLAIPVTSIEEAEKFYCDLLGCKKGNYEEGKWQDIDFWGNELTLHETTPRQGKGPERERHSVDMGEVCVPHFGIHLAYDDFQVVKESVEANGGFLDTPYIRFEGTDYQQETFFVEDPNFNVLEIKSMAKDNPIDFEVHGVGC